MAFLPGTGNLIVTGKGRANTKIQGVSKLPANAFIMLVALIGRRLSGCYLYPLFQGCINMFRGAETFGFGRIADNDIAVEQGYSQALASVTI